MDGSAETICALASGAPPSAIALIRLSGPNVQTIAERCLTSGCPVPRKVTLDRLTGPDGQAIDEGLIAFMPGPNSYTGEDVLEVSLHGGRVVVDKALDCFVSLGARLAEPGEFTRRAFEAGKLDLTQAEAIADLIDAESDAQHAQALQQLGGALGELYEGWRAELTETLALLEASIDFPDEEDAPETVFKPVSQKLTSIIATLKTALQAGNLTERIRDGFRIAILGAPNAGKSTLLNQLAGREAAIVTDIPGTTRDVVEVRRILGPHLVWISDTAGLRETDDLVEAEGVRRAYKAGEAADIRIWLVDGLDPVYPDQAEIRQHDLIAVNKSDMAEIQAADVSRETICIAAKHGIGIDQIETALTKRLEAMGQTSTSPVLTRARHRQAIQYALTALEKAQDGLRSDIGAELVAEDVRFAAYQLSSLTGKIDVEEILGAVFSSFCIGK